MEGLGIFFVNPQVQPTQTIYIKAHVSGVHSVLMAEAAALALQQHSTTESTSTTLLFYLIVSS